MKQKLTSHCQFSKVFKFESLVNFLILTDLINSVFQIDSVSDNDANYNDANNNDANDNDANDNDANDNDKTMIIFANDFSESGSDFSEQ